MPTQASLNMRVHRAQKQRHGLCVYGGCRSHRVTAHHCEVHRVQHNQWMQVSMRKQRARRSASLQHKQVA